MESGEFTGKLNIREGTKTKTISILNAKFKEEKISEVSLSKFNTKYPCPIQRRNCELTIANQLMDTLQNLNEADALEMCNEYMEYDYVELIYQ